MANEMGDFTEPVTSLPAPEPGTDRLGGYFASLPARSTTLPPILEEPENPADPTTQLEDPVHDNAELTNSEEEAESLATMKLPRYISEALFIADLHPLAIENVGSLLDLFSSIGTVSVVKVIPKPPGTKGTPVCSAYVNFHRVEDACRAWQTLNYHVWMGQPMRIMFSNLDPATRYNEEANIIVTDLDESIDSKFLHRSFCKYGAVVSSKVVLDPIGNSTGRAFIQFEDAIDAKRAIEVMNNQKLRGRKVYVGPFIRREVQSEADETNKDPNDLNHVHIRHVEVDDDFQSESRSIGKNGSRDILRGSPSISGKRSPDLQSGTSDPAYGLMGLQSSNSGKATSNAETQGHEGGREVKEREKKLRRGSSASRNMARRRFNIGKELQEMIRGKATGSDDCSQEPVDLPIVLSSEPWPQQPWSFETLKDRLTKSQCREERLAMLGATFFPLVARQTKNLVSDVTNVLVKLDIVHIERFMNLSNEGLQQTVNAMKEHILQRLNSPPDWDWVPPSLVDVSDVESCENEKHIIVVEDVKEVSKHVPAPVPARAPKRAPQKASKRAPKKIPKRAPKRIPASAGVPDSAPVLAPTAYVNFSDFCGPSFPVPVVPEFLHAPALPGLGFGIPVIPFPLVPLPLVPLFPAPIPLVPPYFPDSVLNHTGNRPGTGFFEPRAEYLGRFYHLAATLARESPFDMDEAIAAEEYGDEDEEYADADQAQALEESDELMEEVARVERTQCEKESGGVTDEVAQEDQMKTVRESADCKEQVTHVEQARADGECAEHTDEVVQVEQAKIVEECADCKDEGSHVERAQAAQESAEGSEQIQALGESDELMEEVARVEQDQCEEESGGVTDEVAQEDQTQTVRESTDCKEQVTHVEQGRAEGKFAELTDEVVQVEQAKIVAECTICTDEGSHVERAEAAQKPAEGAEQESAEVAEQESAKVAELGPAEVAEQESAEVVMEKVANEEGAHAEEESIELTEEAGNVERAQVVKNSAELMEEVANLECANAVEQSVQLTEYVAHVDLAEPKVESVVQVMEGVTTSERAPAVEESLQLVEDVGHVERAEAREDSVEELIQEVAQVEQLQHLEEPAKLMGEIAHEE